MTMKIVLTVHMHCAKCRTKAMKLVASAEGVASVAVDGKEQDQVVVTGDGVDSVKLVKRLRKSVGHTDIVSVNEVKKAKAEEAKVEYTVPSWYPSGYVYPNSQFVVNDGGYASGPSCSIM